MVTEPKRQEPDIPPQKPDIQPEPRPEEIPQDKNLPEKRIPTDAALATCFASTSFHPVWMNILRRRFKQ